MVKQSNYWHKELKCRHIIALACRLQLASYKKVAYNAPLATKRKPGRPAVTAICLQKQANELQEAAIVDICRVEDDKVVIAVAIYVAVTNITVPKKRGRPPKILIDNQNISTKNLTQPTRVSKRFKKN